MATKGVRRVVILDPDGNEELSTECPTDKIGEIPVTGELPVLSHDAIRAVNEGLRRLRQMVQGISTMRMVSDKSEPNRGSVET